MKLPNPQFSLRGLILTIASCVFLFWVLWVFLPQRGLKEAARVLAAHELSVLHWKELETHRDFKPVIDQMSQQFIKGAMDYQWKARFIDAVLSSNGSRSSVDAFESHALAAIQAGTEEVWEQSWKGKSRYARAVRVGTSCLACHPTSPTSRTFKANDLMGFVSIEVARN